MMPINVRTEVVVQANCVAAYTAAACEALEQAVKFGPKAVAVRLFQDAKDPTMFVILETWDAPNVEAIKTAMAMSPGYQAYLNKTRPMEAKPTIVRFPTTVAEYGLARVPSMADDKSTLWVALVDTVVVEANDAFEKTARTLLSELAKFPESEYINLAHDLDEPSKWFWTERWATTEAWWTGSLFDTQAMKDYLGNIKGFLVEPPVVRTGLRLVYSYDRA